MTLVCMMFRRIGILFVFGYIYIVCVIIRTQYIVTILSLSNAEPVCSVTDGRQVTDRCSCKYSDKINSVLIEIF
jgi:hypothetical protein